MCKRKGFTLVELMVVILIVAILAAIAIPIMRGRIDAAKWAEGKAIMGTIATALRAYVAEKGKTFDNFDAVTANTLGFLDSDLTGTYFTNAGAFTWSGQYDQVTNALEFVAQSPEEISYPNQVILNELGEWTEN
jgi:prepilin-type N-terminal cleavage/methylation domain-containing protein